jgi:ATP-dependent DNA ligase
MNDIRCPVRQVKHVVVENETQLKEAFQTWMDEGYEGVMLKKLDAPYSFKRSDNMLKLKPCVTYEGVIVGHHEGRRGTKREGLFGGFEVMLHNGIVTRVGSGFNDSIKAEVELNGAESYVGKVLEIEAQPDPLTVDGLTKDGKARFPVFVRFRDASDVDPKLFETYEIVFPNVK